MPIFDDLVPATAGDAERRLVAVIRSAAAAIPADLPALTWDPDRCPPSWLPVLADALGVPCLDSDGALELTPDIIRLALRLAREAGTPAAPASLLAAAGAAGAVVTEPPDRPYREMNIRLRNTAALVIDLQCLVTWLELVCRRAVRCTVTAEAGIAPEQVLHVAVAGGVVVVPPPGALREVL